MKRAQFLCIALLMSIAVSAQEPTFLLMEFMKVDPSKGAAYWETETFWQKIHEQRAIAGDIVGWDLFSLTPGDITDGYQYMTVQQFTDPAKMMGDGMSWDKLLAYAKKAYPDMSEKDIEAKIMKSGDSRLLDKRRFIREVNGTDGELTFKKGMVIQFDFMKVDFNSMGAYDAYHKAENDVFKPDHQKQVDAGFKMGWGLGMVMSPMGSDTYATHITWNFFNDWNHYFNRWEYDGGEPSKEMMAKIKAGLATRDMRMSILAELQMMARAPE